MGKLKPTMSLWRGKEKRVWYRNSNNTPQQRIDQKVSVNIRRHECYRETAWPNWHLKHSNQVLSARKEVQTKATPFIPVGSWLLQLWEMIWKFLKGLKIELVYDPTASVLGMCHLLAKVPVYPRSSQHYPSELRHGHGDHDWWVNKK